MQALTPFALKEYQPNLNLAGELIRAQKIASAAVRMELGPVLSIVPTLESPRAGDVVAVRVLTENATYGVLELAQGRHARLNSHDIVIGVLGARKALKGFVGAVPAKLEQGDILHLLNMGGVMGVCTGGSSELGQAIQLEFLGAVLDGDKPATIKTTALPPAISLKKGAPLIIVGGTCMNSGKTQVATQLIKHFSRQGKRVAAAKLSGVACLRDTLNMRDHGAFETLSFHDCGLPSTVDITDLAPFAKAVLNELNTHNPDLIIVELGDGILGGYGVGSLLKDRQLRAAFSAFIFCASDFVGAWGGKQLLGKMGIPIDVISGSCTDSNMGIEFIGEHLQIPAANALKQGEELHQLVAARLHAKSEGGS